MTRIVRRASAFLLPLAIAALALVPLPAVATRVPLMPLPDLFGRSAAIYLATVRSVETPCPDREAPCTAVTFADVELVAGRLPEGELRFLLPEGVLPDGTWLGVLGAPRFHEGLRYLVFVRAGDWYNTPVTNWFHSVFREVALPGSAGESFFVDPFGRAVLGVDAAGFHLGEALAPPEDALGGGPLGALASRPVAGLSQGPRPSAEAREALAGERSLDEMALPAGALVEAIRALAETYPLAKDGAVSLAPAAPALRRAQASEERMGLEPAVPEPAREPDSGDGFSPDSRPLPEPMVRRPAGPGQTLE